MYKNLNVPFNNADTGNGGGTQTTDNPTNNDKQVDPVPYDRFKSVNDEKNEFKKKYEELLNQQKQDEEETKKKQGEFEGLYTDLKSKYEPLESQFKQYQETFQSILKTKLDSVPENMRDLVPAGNELEQLKWIENAISKNLFKQDNPKSFGNNGDNPNNESQKQKSGFLKGLSRF